MSSQYSWLWRRLRAIPRISVTEAGIATVRVAMAGAPPRTFRLVPAMWLRGIEAVPQARALAAATLPTSTLLLVKRLTRDLREALAEAGVSWVEETGGVVHLDASPLLVHVEQDPTANTARAVRPDGDRLTKLSGLAGRCIETLLLQCIGRAHADLTVTTVDLADAAGVSQPQAKYVLDRLERESLVRAVRPGARASAWVVTHPEAMLDLWATEERAPTDVEPLYFWASSDNDVLRRLATLGSALEASALGAASAASLYAPTLTVRPTPTLWIPNDIPIEQVMRALDARRDPELETMRVLRTRYDAWKQHRVLPDDRRYPDAARGLGGPSIVSPPRALIETLQMKGGRTTELAEALRRTLQLPAPDTSGDT